jgi:hypothetical protein
MQEEFLNMEGEEQLKAENDFLKMKLMLEHGGQFSENENSEADLPPEIENQFLNNILAFEKQFADRKTIKVFDKLAQPRHFKPVAEITDAEMEQAWNELSSYMNSYGINLEVCSPNIPVRELYRFTIEELFQMETDDMDLPGWCTNFIYDEFYPDPVYDNSRLVEYHLFYDIFCKRELFSEICYPSEGFVFNDKEYEQFKPFSEKVNRFKSLFDEIELKEFNITRCSVEDNDCYINGSYEALAKMAVSETVFAGDFMVRLIKAESGYWEMKEIKINGFSLE